MAQSFLILLTLATTFVCFLAFGTYAVKSIIWKTTRMKAMFPGAGFFRSSPAQVTEKYQLSIYPATWAISIIWPVVILWNVIAMAYLLYKSLSGSPCFRLPSRTFFLWTAAWFLTTIWTFLFDRECHLGTLTAIFFVMIFSYKILSISSQHYGFIASRNKSGNALSHPFRYLVVEAHAVLAMWSSVAFAISIGYALAYKNSLHMSTAVLTEIFTPEESATAGTIFIIVSFFVWWILDVTYWRELADCIQVIYPGFALVILSLGLSNYSPENGMSLNNALCFGMSAISTLAMLTRRRAKEFFFLQQHTPVTANGNHRE